MGRFKALQICTLRLIRSRAGGITLFAGLSLTVVLGALGLAVDLGRGLAQRMVNQRVADAAALGAALAYRSNSNAQLLTPVAQDIAGANAMERNAVSAALVANMPASGDQAVRVTVSTQLPFTLARVVGAPLNFTVEASSFATATAEPQYAPPCFLALSSGDNAVQTTGGATIVTPNCSVAAVGQINNAGTRIEAADIISGSGQVRNDYGSLAANSIRFATSFSNPAWNGNVPPASKRINQGTTLVDPWAGNADLASARAQIGSFTAVPALTNPSTPSADNWDFNYSPASNVAPFRVGSSNVYNVPAGNYAIGRLSIAGGITVNFASGSNITIASGFANGGNRATFGDVNLWVNGGFNSGSSGVTIGNGTLHIGSGTVSFAGQNSKGDGDVVINAPVAIGGGSSLTLGAGSHRFQRFTVSGGGYSVMGPGAFQANTGVEIGGNSELSLGNGDILLGRHSDGNAISLLGSGRMFMGDGAFSADGHVVTQGGSRIRFPVTTNHYINGNLTIAGSALFGAGRYTIAGNFTNGTGGTVWPYSSPYTGISWGDSLEGEIVSGFDMAGVDVTFILGGTLNLAGGARTRLIAPTRSLAGGQIREMLVHSQTNAATSWAAGAVSVFVGVVHLPNSNVTMSGGSSNLSAGQCFSLIANTIAATGGAAAGSACSAMALAYGSDGSGSAVRLVR
jgi:Flp pilus assembly protein TadG